MLGPEDDGVVFSHQESELDRLTRKETEASQNGRMITINDEGSNDDCSDIQVIAGSPTTRRRRPTVTQAVSARSVTLVDDDTDENEDDEDDTDDTDDWDAAMMDAIEERCVAAESGGAKLGAPAQAAGLVAELVRSAEWDTIVDKQLAPGESMSIQAAAGAGKTTVLAERVRMRPGQQHLVLAYNKSVQQAKENEFLADKLFNVDVKTVNSVAFGATRGIHNGQVDRSGYDTDYTVERALKSIPDFQRTGLLGKGDGSAVGRTLGCFLASTDEAPTATHVCSKDLQEGKSSVRCVTYARMLWSGMQKQPGAVGHVRVSHDGYLKMFQLGLRRGIYKSAFAKWDCVMLDEGHDCTDAMVDACHAPCRAKTASFITIYDPNQCIYQFKYAFGEHGLIGRLNSTWTFRLSSSFRFGPEVGTLATGMIRFFEPSSDFRVNGVAPWGTTAVEPLDEGVYSRAFHPGSSHPHHATLSQAERGGPRQLAVIGRSNAGLMVALRHILASPAVSKIHFIGGFDDACGGLALVQDVYNFKHGNKTYTSAKKGLLSCFRGGFEQLKSFAEEKGESDMLRSMKIMEQMGDVPTLLNRARSIHTSDESEAQVILSTAHKAKGLGWPQVYLLPDFFGCSSDGTVVHPPSGWSFATGRSSLKTGMYKTQGDLAAKSLFDSAVERNIAYVGITRAKAVLYISKTTHDWMAPFNRPVLSSSTTNASQPSASGSSNITDRSSGNSSGNGAVKFTPDGGVAVTKLKSKPKPKAAAAPLPPRKPFKAVVQPPPPMQLPRQSSRPRKRVDRPKTNTSHGGPAWASGSNASKKPRSPLQGTADAMAPPSAGVPAEHACIVTQPELFEIESIVSAKPGLTEFKVKWVGYPASESTWEPATSLSVELIQAWQAQQPAKKKKRKKKRDL